MHRALPCSWILITIGTIFVILEEWIWHSYKWDILYPMIRQPLLHFQIFLVYLKRFAVCKTFKIIIPSACTNQDTWNSLRRGGAPWISDKPGVDGLDAFLLQVIIEDMCLAVFYYYEPTSESELIRCL